MDLLAKTTPVQQAAQRLKQGAPALLQMLTAQRNGFHRIFWAPPPGTDRQAWYASLLAELGTSAVSLVSRDFVIAQALRTLYASILDAQGQRQYSDAEIAALVPGVPAGWALTPNQDGTVTVTGG